MDQTGHEFSFGTENVSPDSELSKILAELQAAKEVLECEKEEHERCESRFAEADLTGESLVERITERERDFSVLKSNVERLLARKTNLESALESESARNANIVNKIKAEQKDIAELGGVELLSVSRNALQMRLRTTVRKQVAIGSKFLTKRPVFFHDLSLGVVPGVGTVTSGTLNPPDVKIDDIIEKFSNDRDEKIGWMVSLIHARLHSKLQRTVMLSDDTDEFKLRKIDANGEIYRAALSCRAELEFRVPLAWPLSENAQLEILDIEPPSLKMDLKPVADKLKGEGELGRKKLCEFLRYIDTAVSNSIPA